ncbi:MAG: zinc-binding dehydrogenase, partial [Verrucomicrobiota bacterium]
MIDRVRSGVGDLLENVQKVLTSSEPPWPQLTVVTQGATGADCRDPAQAAAWGLARTIEREHPELRCRRIDLDPELSVEDQWSLVEAELASDSVGSVRYRAGKRYVSRLVRSASIDRLPDRPDKPFQVSIERDAGSGRLCLLDCDRIEPAEGQIEIRVEAAGINFIDGLDIAGMLPFKREWLGVECAGEVVRVGKGAAFDVGDKIVALAPGSFRQFVTVPTELVARRNLDLTPGEAATLPANYLTAERALRDAAELKAGESVLIHAGAGGTGMAAIHVAQSIGAEVYATASSGKWQAVRTLGVRAVLDSRKLEFGDRIREMTGARGVDVVLNSLVGDYIPKGLAALAPNGRFVELGKREIWDGKQVADVRPDVSYHVVDLFAESKRAAGGGRPLLLGLEDRSKRPLPKTSFPVEESPRAVEYFQRSRHIGKVVVDFRDGASPVRADGCYLITGGVG